MCGTTSIRLRVRHGCDDLLEGWQGDDTFGRQTEAVCSAREGRQSVERGQMPVQQKVYEQKNGLLFSLTEDRQRGFCLKLIRGLLTGQWFQEDQQRRENPGDM